VVYIKDKNIIFIAFLFLFIGFISTSNITGLGIFDRIFGVSIGKNANPITETCTDSDGGKNYNITGYAYGYFVPEGGFFKDSDFCALYNNKNKVTSCSGSACSLYEYYCASSTTLGRTPYTCPNGCSDGKCISQTQSCTNECSYSGQRYCTNITNYAICGNYDSDSCLEYIKKDCSYGQECDFSSGYCIQNQTQSCTLKNNMCCKGENYCLIATIQIDCLQGYSPIIICDENCIPKGKCIPQNQTQTVTSGLASTGSQCKTSGLCSNNNQCCTGYTCSNGQCTPTGSKCIGTGCSKSCNGRQCVSNCGNDCPGYICYNNRCILKSTPTPSPTCSVGPKCYNGQYAGYRNGDCTWNGIVFCGNGCDTNTGICSIKNVHTL
jgi:hypothetical protein